MKAVKILEARRAELQALFDIESKKENEAREEKLRLQGEYRLLNDLINKLEKDK